MYAAIILVINIDLCDGPYWAEMFAPCYNIDLSYMVSSVLDHIVSRAWCSTCLHVCNKDQIINFFLFLFQEQFDQS